MSPLEAPSAEGSLERTPIPHLLVYVADHELTGSLVLRSRAREGGEVSHLVYFEDGAPAKLRTGEPVAYLGRVLLDLGLVDPRTLDESLAVAPRTRELLGAYLVRVGKLDANGLLAGLKAQALQRLDFIAELPPATLFQFYQGRNLLADWGGPELLPLDPLPVIWHAVRSAASDALVGATLGRLERAPLRLHPQSDPGRFGFGPGELAAIDLIRASRPALSELVAANLVDARAVHRLVYTLLITRHLDHGPETPPPVGLKLVPSSSRLRAVRPVGTSVIARVRLRSKAVGGSGPPVKDEPVAEPSRRRAIGPDGVPRPRDPRVELDSLSEAAGARARAILDRAGSIDREDYFTMLGVSREASEEEIQRAYYAQAKVWHPDRLPPELAGLRADASRVFARLSEAFETLSDQERRKRYANVLKGGSGTPEEAEQIQRVLDAAGSFQRAGVYFKKRDIVNAISYAKRAYESDPAQADYAALYAQILAEQRTGADAMFADLLALLDEALSGSPNSESALLVRAHLRKRVGRIAEALEDYRKVLALNPKNVDAAREVRLFEMRKSKHPEAAASAPSPLRQTLSGLSKLFKGPPKR